MSNKIDTHQLHNLALRVATAAPNTIALDYVHNLQLIKQAIDLAIADHADILLLPELALTGYDLGDAIHDVDNETVLTCLNALAKHAQHSPMIIAVGHPWYYPAQEQTSATNPRDQNYLICQSFIQQGVIKGMQTKTTLANNTGDVSGPEYEPRYFRSKTDISWITINNQNQTIPIGNFSFALGQGQVLIKSYLAICESIWVGMLAENKTNTNPLAQKIALEQQQQCYTPYQLLLSVHASPEDMGRYETRKQLCKQLATYFACHTYYVNNAGNQAGAICHDGCSISCTPEGQIQRSARFVFTDINYNAQTIKLSVPELTDIQRDAIILKLDYPIELLQASQTKLSQATIGYQPAAWDNNQARQQVIDQLSKLQVNNAPIDFAAEIFDIAEPLRHDALYGYDYLVKNKLPGYFISLSGGYDSAYSLTVLSLAIEFRLRSLAQQYQGDLTQVINKICIELVPAKTIKTELYRQNYTLDQLIQRIRQASIQSAYIKTSNNSMETEQAAKQLADYFGLKFTVITIDDAMISVLLSYAGINISALDATGQHDHIAGTIRRAMWQVLNASDSESLTQAIKIIETQLAQSAKSEINMTVIPTQLLSWHDQAHGLPLENLQARIRAAVNWLIAGHQQLVPTANPNKNESAMSYTTYGGDQHAGPISITLHRDKNEIQAILSHIANYSISDHTLMGSIAPVTGLSRILALKASAELQPLVNQQHDEKAYGFNYRQLRVLTQLILFTKQTNTKLSYRRLNPSEVYISAKHHPAFKSCSPVQLFDAIESCYSRWTTSHFKRRAAPIAPAMRKTVDPHYSLRMPTIGVKFLPERCYLAIEVCVELLGNHITAMQATDWLVLKTVLYQNKKVINTIQQRQWHEGNQSIQHVCNKYIDYLAQPGLTAEQKTLMAFLLNKQLIT